MKYLTTFFFALLVVGGFGLYVNRQPVSFGNVITQGIVPKISTEQTAVVGTTSINTIVAANSACTSRTITTVAQPVMLSFSSVLTPSAVAGHYQAASTTVVYDNAQFGCGDIKAYGYAPSTALASTTITVLESSQ